MEREEFFRLPATLLHFRTNKGLSQGAAAVSAGVNQSGLCALERGRRVATAQALQRIAEAWQLDQADLEQLHCAREHDELLRLVSTQRYAKAVAAFSELAQFVEGLSPDECQVVALQLRQARQSTAHSRKWTRRGSEPQEVPMT